MTAPYIPNQGDLIWLDFDPSAEREIIKRRPAFVISRQQFNEHTGLAIIAPVTSTIRHIKLEVVLPATLQTAGAILTYQLRSLDWQARNAQFIEMTGQKVTQAVQKLTALILA